MNNTFKHPYFEIRGQEVKSPKKINAYLEFLLAVKFRDYEKLKVLKKNIDISHLYVSIDFFSNYCEDKKKAHIFDLAVEEEVSDELLMILQPENASTQQIMQSFMVLLETSREEDDFKKIIATLLKKIKINDLIGIDSNYRPKYFVKKPSSRLSLLHFACQEGNRVAMKVLLENGADPSLKGFKDGSMTYPVNSVYSYYKRKGVHHIHFECLTLLLQHNADLNLRTTPSHKSLFSLVIEKSSIPMLRKVLELRTPSSINEWSAIKKKSASLYAFFAKKKIDLSKHKMLQNIFKYEKRVIWFSGDSKQINCDRFFQYNSLKDALTRRYGVSSSNFTKKFEKLIFARSSEKVYINLNVFLYLDLLKMCFLEKEKPNFSDFVETFLNTSDENILLFGRNLNHSHLVTISKILDLYHVDFHIKDLLGFKNDQFNRTEIKDMVEMFKKHPKVLGEHLQLLDFKDKNSFNKIHDQFVIKIECMSQENFDLKQEASFPSLAKIHDEILPSGYQIKVAQKNHDLISWGSLLGHCVGNGSYADDILEKNCCIISLFKDNTVKYCVEIDPNNKTIEQIQGKSGTFPEPIALKEFQDVLKSKNIIKKSFNYRE